MATVAGRAASAAQTERVFFSSLAVALTLFVFAGFAPTYFLLPVLHGTTISGFADGAGLTPLVHFHAVANSAWLVLLVAQTSLISAGRADLHRRIGMASVLLIAVILVSGLAVAIVAGQLRHGPPGRNPHIFLIQPFGSVIGFALLAGLGILWRRRSAFHKRLMMLATISLAIPAGARLATMSQPSVLPAGPPGGMLLADMFLAALVVFDLATRRKLHPATLWAGGAFLLSEPLRMAIGQTRAWQGLAALMIG